MRTVFAAFATVASLGGCDPSPCEKPLEQWCHHSGGAGGPVVPEGAAGADCAPPALANPEVCGRYEVVSSGADLVGEEHFFLDGQHVATRYWTDTDTYCGDHSFWYGERVDCE